MEKEKLIEFIASNQSTGDQLEIDAWINAAEENREEYIRYKNLWALMQHGNDMPEAKVQDALSQVRWSRGQNRRTLGTWNFVKYAAFVVMALLGGYLIGKTDFTPEVAMNEIFVPNGNRSLVTLPDGTKAWINNGTKLIYPAKFKGNDRIVALEGEGFFDVTHDKEHPFIVKIGENRIKVLGTKFAVIAYPEDKFIKAELISGQIQFDVKEKSQTNKFYSYLIEPSQSLLLEKSSGKVSESKISDGFYDYWLNGVYQFKDEAFEELAKKIGRIYNVEVTFNDETLKKRLFSGTLSINDNIYSLMEAFKSAAGKPFVYTHQGNHIYISKEN